MEYVAQRLLFSLLSLFVLLAITFLLTHLSAADPAVVAAGPNAGADKIAFIRTEMGLDKPVLTQFAIYCGDILRGDLRQRHGSRASRLRRIWRFTNCRPRLNW